MIMAMNLAALSSAFLLVFLSSVIAQPVNQTQPCPPVTVQPDFHVTSYVGQWYEISSVPNFFQEGTTCSTANYSPLNGTHIKVDNRATAKNKTAIAAVGQAHIPDPTVAAKLLVQFPQSPFQAPYWVLETDYNHYAVVYSCSSFPGRPRTDLAWVLSRTPVLEQKYKDSVAAVFTRNNLDASRLKQTVQENCVNY